MIHGLANGVFLDDKRFWPIFERAEALDVPIYLHPSVPHAGGDGRLLQGLRQGLPDGGARRLGLHGGDRDAGDPPGAQRACSTPIPKLKIVLGHLGETLPFLVWRVDHGAGAAGRRRR